MGLQAPVTGGGGNFEKPPAGTYTGVCNGIYNCGKQEGYQGGKPVQKLLLTFELHKRKGPARDSGGRIFECSTTVTNVCNTKSNLIAQFAGPMRGRAYTEADVEALRKQGGFDPETLLGLACKVTLEIGRSGSPYLAKTAPLDPEDDAVPEMVTDTVYWDYTLDGDVPKRCAWLWAKSLDNPDRTGQAAMAGLAVSKAVETDGDVPF